MHQLGSKGRPAPLPLISIAQTASSQAPAAVAAVTTVTMTTAVAMSLLPNLKPQGEGVVVLSSALQWSGIRPRGVAVGPAGGSTHKVGDSIDTVKLDWGLVSAKLA